MEWRSGVWAGARNHKVGSNDLHQPEFTPNRGGGSKLSPLLFQNFLTCRAVVCPLTPSKKSSLLSRGHPSVFEPHLGSFGALSKMYSARARLVTLPYCGAPQTVDLASFRTRPAPLTP